MSDPPLDDFAAEPRGTSKTTRNILIALAVAFVVGGVGLYALVPKVAYLYGDYQLASTAVAAEPGAQLSGYRIKSTNGVSCIIVTFEPSTSAGSAAVTDQIDRIGSRLLAKLPAGRTLFVAAHPKAGGATGPNASGHGARRFGPALPADVERAVLTGD